jgi:hypothetical protein
MNMPRSKAPSNGQLGFTVVPVVSDNHKRDDAKSHVNLCAVAKVGLCSMTYLSDYYESFVWGVWAFFKRKT